MENTNEFYTRKEVAEKFRVTLPTLKKWRDTGTLPAYKIGGVVRFKKNEIGMPM